MQYSCQSEYLPLERVLLNPVAHSFISDKKIQAEWKALNYHACPDLEIAEWEYGGFEALLRERGIQCEYLPLSDDTSIDAIYCRDASITTDHGMILCRMGKAARRAEPALHEAYFRSRNIPILGRIEAPGTLEGGDLAWLGWETLAVGHSYRTNRSGIAQLKTLLSPFDIEVLVVELPHYRGPADVFHLMSVWSPVAGDLAVAYSPLLPIAFREEVLSRGYRIIEVPDAEFQSMGCNVLALSPQTCIVVSGNPETQKALTEAGLEVLTYKGDEISLKGGGGPTCLTRPLRRTI